jgi:putative oxidoreductase
MSGLGKIANFSGTQQYMAAYGMPMTSLFLIGAIILEVGGGLSILLGYKAKWGALALIIFIIPATLIFHTNFSDQTQMIMFMKNIAILGGLVLIVANGAGSLSLDNRTTRT